MKKIILSLVGFIILLFTLLITHFNAPIMNLTIYAKDGSYATKYASKHSIPVEEVAQSEESKLSIVIEEFEYNKIDGGIEIISYSGVSKRLIIPTMIDGLNVISIKDTLFENKNIETIIISNKVKNVDDSNIKIECEKSSYCDSLIKDENRNAVLLKTSEKIDFMNYSGLVEYNLENNEIEVVKSFNVDSATIIPESVNGYPVTKINVDLDKTLKVYIPESVSNIQLKGTDNAWNYIAIASVISYLLFLIIVLTNSNSNLNSMTKNVALYIVSILYMLIITYFSMNYSDTYYIQVIISSLVYIVIAIALKINKTKSIKYEDSIKEKTRFVEDTLTLLDDVDRDNKYELRDIIRYSDPISIDEVRDIEKEIQESIRNLDDKKALEVRKLIKKRNNIIKKRK